MVTLGIRSSVQTKLSDGEWHRVKDWLKLAETAIRKDHDLRHEAATIPLEWRGIPNLTPLRYERFD